MCYLAFLFFAYFAWGFVQGDPDLAQFGPFQKMFIFLLAALILRFLVKYRLAELVQGLVLTAYWMGVGHDWSFLSDTPENLDIIVGLYTGAALLESIYWVGMAFVFGPRVHEEHEERYTAGLVAFAAIAPAWILSKILGGGDEDQHD